MCQPVTVTFKVEGLEELTESVRLLRERVEWLEQRVFGTERKPDAPF